MRERYIYRERETDREREREREREKERDKEREGERVREREGERGRERGATGPRPAGQGVELRTRKIIRTNPNKPQENTRSTAPAALTEIENDMKDRWFTDHVSERMRNKALFLCQQKKSSSKFGNLASGQPVSHRRFRNFRLPSGQPVRQKWIT
jgi:hypothetical protein